MSMFCCGNNDKSIANDNNSKEEKISEQYKNNQDETQIGKGQVKSSNSLYLCCMNNNAPKNEKGKPTVIPSHYQNNKLNKSSPVQNADEVSKSETSSKITSNSYQTYPYTHNILPIQKQSQGSDSTFQYKYKLKIDNHKDFSNCSSKTIRNEIFYENMGEAIKACFFQEPNYMQYIQNNIYSEELMIAKDNYIQFNFSATFNEKQTYTLVATRYQSNSEIEKIKEMSRKYKNDYLENDKIKTILYDHNDGQDQFAYFIASTGIHRNKSNLN